MKLQLEKKPRIALCRRCGGKGFVVSKETDHDRVLCSQCLGSGRVTVSANIEYDIRPYKKEI